jgi:hypothetical protein
MKTPRKMTEVHNPYFVVFPDPKGHDNTVYHVHTRGLEYGVPAIAAAHLMRHIAASYDIDGNKAWEVVDQERQNPSGSINRETKH